MASLLAPDSTSAARAVRLAWTRAGYSGMSCSLVVVWMLVMATS
jgi:hypothetical protein